MKREADPVAAVRVPRLQNTEEQEVARVDPKASPNDSLTASQGGGCINCGETENGGYQTEEAGPFCGECWTLLEAHFIRPYLAHAFVDGVPPEDEGFCRECGEGQAHTVHQVAPLVAPAGVPDDKEMK